MVVLSAPFNSSPSYIFTNNSLERTESESMETTAYTRRLSWAGALLRMGYHRLPERVMSGELEDAGKRGPRGKEKYGRTAWQMTFGYLASRGTGALSHLTLGYGIVVHGGCRSMVAWVKEEEKASEHRQRKRGAEEADKVEVAPGVNVSNLRRCKAR